MLELAGGTGQWTAELAKRAARLTVIDTSAEMLALNHGGSSTPRQNWPAPLSDRPWRCGNGAARIAALFSARPSRCGSRRFTAGSGALERSAEMAGSARYRQGTLSEMNQGRVVPTLAQLDPHDSTGVVLAVHALVSERVEVGDVRAADVARPREGGAQRMPRQAAGAVIE